MSFEGVRIEELVLQLPGLPGVTRERARLIAQEVASRLAHELPGSGLRTVPSSLSLRVTVPPGTPTERLAEVITAQIRRALT
jgi:hypothetical protein